MASLEEAFAVARNARTNAYAPYSGFHVGAAVKPLGRDQLFAGCNVENASYGATICAERSAIVSMVSQCGKCRVEYVVVVTDAEPPAVPCAICLQVLAEFCAPETMIHLADTRRIRTSIALRELLPQPFVLA